MSEICTKNGPLQWTWTTGIPINDTRRMWDHFTMERKDWSRQSNVLAKTRTRRRVKTILLKMYIHLHFVGDKRKLEPVEGVTSFGKHLAMVSGFDPHVATILSKSNTYRRRRKKWRELSEKKIDLVLKDFGYER